MKPEHVLSLIGRWGGTMKFFPAGADERIGIAEEIAGMAANIDQVRWLVSRVPKLYKEWPGVHEVRAVFCSKFKPRDGFDAVSAIYLDGVPSEHPERNQITSADYKQLPAAAAELLREILPQTPIERKAAAEGWLNSKRPQGQAPYPTQAEIEALKAAQERNRVSRVQPVATDAPEGLETPTEANSTEAARERNRQKYELEITDEDMRRSA